MFENLSKTLLALLLGLISTIGGAKVAKVEPEITPIVEEIESFMAPSEIPILPTNIPTSTENIALPKKYNLKFYDVANAKQKSMVKSGQIDKNTENSIIKALNSLNIKPEIINQYAFVFVTGDYYSTANPMSIDLNGKDVPIGGLGNNGDPEAALGMINQAHKYVLLLNSLKSGELESVLSHELGHIIVDSLNPEVFKKYMEIRKFPQSYITAYHAYWKRNQIGEPPFNTPPFFPPWNERPNEDFCEVFKYLYGSKSEGGNWEVRTKQGPPSAEIKAWFDENIQQAYRE